MELAKLNTLCYTGILSIVLTVLLGFAFVLTGSMPEICDNAVDDDNDGLIDLNDEDCFCVIVDPVSLIPNPSFEDLNCCPGDRSQLNCAEVWIQASEPTTDLIHRCDWLGWTDFPPPMPFPDGDGIMGFRDGRVRSGSAEPNWKEYAGACLISPLLKDSVYRFQFDLGFVNSERSPPIDISFFGTPDCQNLPFGEGREDLGCPTNGPDWISLGSRRVSGGAGNSWVNTIIEVRPPMNINAIAIGPSCNLISTPVSLYYFFDNLLLADINAFDFQIREVSHPCQPDFTIGVANNASVNYQWYKDGVALQGETQSELNILSGEGDYQVRVDDGISCRVSVVFEHRIPIINNLENVTICKEGLFPFGDQLLTQNGTYIDTFTSINNCDSIVWLSLKVLGTLSDTVKANIFEGETFDYNDRSFRQAGEYMVTLQSSLGCDSLILLQLEYFNIYFPNIFSPNFDGVNDLFRISGEEGTILDIELSMYDRWGVKIAEGSEWDGLKNNVAVNPGVYVYLAKVLMSDGIERVFTKSVTVLK